MENNINFFPKTSEEALALIYVQTNIKAGTSPEELAGMYYDALAKIKAERKKLSESNPKQRISY